jgi:hydrogenase-4 transcriptional activator
VSRPSPHLPNLLADVLGEVCLHLDLEESGPGLLAALARWLPVDGLLFRRLDAERTHLDTVVVAGLGAALGERTVLPTPRRDEVVAFLEDRRPAVWRGRTETSLGRALVPESVSGMVAAIPLARPAHSLGVALLVGDLLGHEEALVALMGPLTAALENDLRIRELSRLRERAEADRRALLDQLGRQDVTDAVIGAESGLREVINRVDQVARTDAPVLVFGETGTGKEVVARAIHQRSQRANGPFLRVNCGAIPTELVDSELFGHEKGSFTGAIAQRKGWFERADGGTLFLDEVGDLPSAAQVRLLRVLQDGTFERVGGQQVHTVDVRIVAATHRDVVQMVKDGTFRQDLWYRISVFPLRLPPLRDREADIPLLARHFAARAGARLFGRPLTLTDRDLQRLQRWDWPGNVRELIAVIERAAILGDGDFLDVETALGHPDQRADGARSPAGAPERESIESALERCLGRIEGPFGAAAALGVNPHTLRSRMRRLGVDWTRYRTR